MGEITIGYIVDIILKRFWIIILTAIVFAGATFAYFSNFVEPTYQAKSSIIATNGGIVEQGYMIDDNTTQSANANKIGSSDVTSSIYLANTFVDIMQTYNFFDALSEQPEISALGYSAGRLKSMASFEIHSNNSLLVDIKIVGSNPEHVVKIANCVSEFAPTYISSLISNAYALPADRSISASQVGPHTFRYSAIIGFLSAVVVIGIFALVSASDDTISSEESIAEHFDVHILGTVPNFENSKKGAR